MLAELFVNFFNYLIEIVPVLILGFLLSGLFNELVPNTFVERFLTGHGLKPIISLILVGTVLPICCFGSLPLAVTFHRRGVRMGPILAFLVATPATSISALLVTWRLLGFKFTLFIFLAVIILGLIMGIIGNLIVYQPKKNNLEEENCEHCHQQVVCSCHYRPQDRIKRILSFSFIELPKEIGLLTLLGIFLAAIVVTFNPIGTFIKNYLGGTYSYLFALIFGLSMYFCSTSSPPLVHAL
ncbi:MAG: permease, partial [candidate division WOR-3 bacterium]|nr:permease [candidate division WOR-3 bacterium]